MDRLPASLHLSSRLPPGPAYGRAGAPASFDPSSGHGLSATAKAPPAKEYGSTFSDGFLQFLRSGDLADVVVEVVTDNSTAAATSSSTECPPGSTSAQLTATTTCSSLGEYHLHGLLLARHSAFFAAALGQAHFADSAARRIRLTLDSAAAPTWPILVDFFYTDRVRLDDTNALPLLALARQLLVSELDSYCTDFVCGRLCASNCIAHLRAAVRFALHDLHTECVALAAQAFPLLYGSDLSGIPPASLLEVITHPMLQVHCELQVAEAVTWYIASTVVDHEAQRALCAQIRFPYLDNATITRLAVQPGIVWTDGMTGGQQISDAVTVMDAAEPHTEVSTAVAAAAAVGDATPAQPSNGVLEAGGSGSGASEGRDVVDAASPPTVAVTRGAEAAADGEPPRKAAIAGGSGNAAAGSSSIVGTVGDGPGDGDTAATYAVAEAGAPSGGGNSGGDDGPGAANAAADSGLLSASSSPTSTSRSSSSGGAAAAAGCALSYTSQSHHSHSSYSGRRQEHEQQPHNRSDADGVAAAAATSAHGQFPPHLKHHQHQQPLLPRDMALEGALARLTAMEYLSVLPHVRQDTSATAATKQPFPHSYLHPYQQHQHQYQYGPGTAAAAPGGGGEQAATAAAATNSSRRQLAVFRVQGGVPQPPQQLAVPPGGGGGDGGGGGGPHAHALAHGLYYNHAAVAAAAAGGGGSGGGVAQPPQHPTSFPPRGLMPSGAGSVYGSAGGASRGDFAHQGVHGAAAAAAGGAVGLDTAAAFAMFCLPPPRPSYCCNVVHGLPGGCAWVDVALETLWEQLVPYIHVQVSGCGEGSPRNVIVSDSDCFFETNDSSDPLPWIEVHLPHNVHVLQLHRYTFLHGHRRAGYYRARNFKTQIAVRPASEIRGPAAAASSTGGGSVHRPGQGQGQGESVAAASVAPPASSCRYVDLMTRMVEQFEVGVLAGATSLGPWRVMRLQATGVQEDGVHRLCVRALRMYGIARVDLMHQADGFVVQPHWLLNARVDPAGAGSAAATTASGGNAGHGYGGGGAASGGGSGGDGHYWMG